MFGSKINKQFNVNIQIDLNLFIKQKIMKTITLTGLMIILSTLLIAQDEKNLFINPQ